MPGEAILSAENGGNLRAVGALPRIPLEELTALRRSLAGGEEVAALFPRIPPPLTAFGLGSNEESWARQEGYHMWTTREFFLYQIKH